MCDTACFTTSGLGDNYVTVTWQMDGRHPGLVRHVGGGLHSDSKEQTAMEEGTESSGFGVVGHPN